MAQRQSAPVASANGGHAGVTLPAPEAPRPAPPPAAAVPRGHRTPPPASPAKSADWQVRTPLSAVAGSVRTRPFRANSDHLHPPIQPPDRRLDSEIWQSRCLTSLNALYGAVCRPGVSPFSRFTTALVGEPAAFRVHLSLQHALTHEIHAEAGWSAGRTRQREEEAPQEGRPGRARGRGVGGRHGACERRAAADADRELLRALDLQLRQGERPVGHLRLRTGAL